MQQRRYHDSTTHKTSAPRFPHLPPSRYVPPRPPGLGTFAPHTPPAANHLFLRILYGIQGTGNGHLARALEIVPLLQQLAVVDVLVSGQHAEVQVPFPITYQYKGLGFIFGKKGGVDLLQTFAKNNTRRLYKEIKNLPIADYDLVINDFEPVSAWAARSKRVPCVALSHQAAVLSPHAPRPSGSDIFGRAILHNYAPSVAQFGFHFGPYDPGIFTPVIRSQVRALTPTNDGHITVYLPAYEDEILIKILKKIKGVEFQVFSKHSQKTYRDGDIYISPISGAAFLASMAAAEGVLCGAGFETPAEALFLGKKLMVVPMKNQYEQQCNAAAAATLGVPVLKNIKKKRIPDIYEWVHNAKPLPAVHFPDQTAAILNHIVAQHRMGAFQNLKIAKPVELISTL